MPLFRENSRRRGYTHSWEQRTARYRSLHPHCIGCEAMGLKHPTQCIDHIIPHKGDKLLFWNENNWQAACNWHHNSIKAELERRWFDKKIPAAELLLSSPTALQLSRERYKPQIGVDGWPVSRET